MDYRKEREWRAAWIAAVAGVEYDVARSVLDVPEKVREKVLAAAVDFMGPPPTEEELAEIVPQKAAIALLKNHRGKPPYGMSFEEYKQEVIIGALQKCRRFRHGGAKTLEEFAFMSCLFTIRDSQRKAIQLLNRQKKDGGFEAVCDPYSMNNLDSLAPGRRNSARDFGRPDGDE
jgi:hypothetical protein